MSRPNVFRLALVIATLVPLLVLVDRITAQPVAPVVIAGTPVPLLAGHSAQRSRVAPPNQLAAGIQSATINVTYTGFSAQAQAAFQAAVNIWQTQINSPVVIRVDAQWTSLPSGVLGAASAAKYVRDFPAAPVAGTFYPIALANKLAGQDLDTDSVDIVAQFSSAFPNWYFNTDGNTPARMYDFESVVLHELGHGLGFAGSMDGSSAQGKWGRGTGFPFIYDRFAANSAGQALLNTTLFPNPSTALETQLTNDNLVFNGAQAVAATGVKPKLYAPLSWEQGSSYSHLDEDTYPAGNANSLMTPILSDGESVHSPGAIMLGIFADMGWNNVSTQATVTTTRTSTSLPATATSTVMATPATATRTSTRTSSVPGGAKRAYLALIMQASGSGQSTATPAPSVTSSATTGAAATMTRTATGSVTATRSATSTVTRTATLGSTATSTVTSTSSATSSATSSPTVTSTPTITATSTRTPSSTPTTTNTPTITRTPTITLTPSITKTQEPT